MRTNMIKFAGMAFGLSLSLVTISGGVLYGVTVALDPELLNFMALCVMLSGLSVASVAVAAAIGLFKARREERSEKQAQIRSLLFDLGYRQNPSSAGEDDTLWDLVPEAMDESWLGVVTRVHVQGWGIHVERPSELKKHSLFPGSTDEVKRAIKKAKDYDALDKALAALGLGSWEIARVAEGSYVFSGEIRAKSKTAQSLEKAREYAEAGVA